MNEFNLSIEVRLGQKVWMIGPDDDEEGFEIYETSVARIVIDQYIEPFVSHFSQTQGSYVELSNGAVFVLDTPDNKEFNIKKECGDFIFAFTLQDAEMLLKAKSMIKSLKEDTAEMLEYKRLHEKYGDIFNK